MLKDHIQSQQSQLTILGSTFIEPLHLFIVGGDPYNARDVAELVEINRPADGSELCWQPPNMPYEFNDAVGSLLNGMITMCGGDSTEE